MATKTLTTSASEVFPRNSARKSFILQNEDGTDSVYIKFERSENNTVSATDHDHRLAPGGAIALNSLTDGSEQIKSRITAIASANTPRISFFETEDITR